jgi:hypothetical protein
MPLRNVLTAPREGVFVLRENRAGSFRADGLF